MVNQWSIVARPDLAGRVETSSGGEGSMKLSAFRLFTALVSLGMMAAACGCSGSGGSGK
jgi:hypothetical protein